MWLVPARHKPSGSSGRGRPAWAGVVGIPSRILCPGETSALDFLSGFSFMGAPSSDFATSVRGSIFTWGGIIRGRAKETPHCASAHAHALLPSFFPAPPFRPSGLTRPTEQAGPEVPPPPNLPQPPNPDFPSSTPATHPRLRPTKLPTTSRTNISTKRQDPQSQACPLELLKGRELRGRKHHIGSRTAVEC